MKKTLLLISLLVLVLSMLVACGGGGNEAPAPRQRSRQLPNRPQHRPCQPVTPPRAKRPLPLAPAATALMARACQAWART